MSGNHREIVESFFALSMEGARSLGEGQLRTRTVHVGYTDALLAVDSWGLPHLLAPVAGPLVEDRRSAAVTITKRELKVEGEARTYADLGCRETDLVRVFDRLVTEVLETAETSGERLDLVQSRTLAEWRHLLSAARAKLSYEATTGLFGELLVLCALAEVEPYLALDAWVGPTGAVRDFSNGDYALEVKTKIASTPERVRISSLRQLDSGGLARLTLAVIDIEDHAIGQSVGQLVDRAVALGVPRLPLMDLLAGVGYVPGMPGDDDRLMSVARLRSWTVGRQFPSLTEGSVPSSVQEAVTAVTYLLDLTRVGAPRVDAWRDLTEDLGWGR